MRHSAMKRTADLVAGRQQKCLQYVLGAAPASFDCILFEAAVNAGAMFQHVIIVRRPLSRTGRSLAYRQTAGWGRAVNVFARH